jgi:hypothetical protein
MWKSISLSYFWGEEITEKMEGTGPVELGGHVLETSGLSPPKGAKTLLSRHGSVHRAESGTR